MTHAGSRDVSETTVDVVLEPRNGEWIFLPRSEAGLAALAELITELGADPTSPPLSRGVEVSLEAAEWIGGRLSRCGIRVDAQCEECRSKANRMREQQHVLRIVRGIRDAVDKLEQLVRPE